MATDWDKVLNWRLLAGSHEFPGPEGGTCINEAAIVAAGFEYRAVSSADDCPPCFSRPLADYAIGLNDFMPDDLRQRLLMPFVLRLAGSADSPAVEKQRVELIAFRTITELLPLALRAVGLEQHADHCESAETLKTAANAAANAANAAANAAIAANAIAANATAANATAANATIWEKAAAILDSALRIGNQAPTLELEEAASRMDAARNAAKERSL